MDELLTIKEAARLLRVNVQTIQRWTNRGILACYRVGPRRDRRFREQDVRQLLEKGEPSANEPTTV